MKLATETEVDGFFWDEPHYALPKPNTSISCGDEEDWSCRCPECMKKFEECYGYEMPKIMNEDIKNFRWKEALKTLADCSKTLKEIKPNLEITVCVHATECSELRGYDNWDMVAACPYFDVLATTIIGWDKPESFFRSITERTVNTARKYGKEAERWIQGYSTQPEDFNQIMSQPIVVGTGKFLKHFGLPVYYSVIKGGYLAMPKFNQTDRIGPIEVDLDIMFTPEQLKELSPEKIEDIINEKMFHDDFRWNLEKKNHYKAKDGKIAEGMETVLFRCPKCGSDKHMRTELDKIWCDNCGNGATILDTYEMVPLNDECVLPETESKWFNDEREIIKEEIKNDPNYSLTPTT